MLTLYRRGKVFWIRGTIAGRRLHRSTRTAERSLAEQVRAGLESREWKRHLYGPEAVLTFAQAVILYLDAGKSDRFLEPLVTHFRNTTVREIKPGTIQQAAVALYPRAGAATRNRQAIAPAQAVINHAAASGLCQTIRVPRFKVTKTIRPFADLAWTLVFTANAGPRLAALDWFLFLTGRRIGAACALDWRDVDLKAATAVIRRPKGQDDEIVHLPPVLVAALANIPPRRAGEERRGKVFGWQDRRSVYAPWRRVCAKAGLAYIPPHRAGRHGFATGLLRAKVDPLTVAKLGGWKSPRHVYETYGHPIDDAKLTELLLKKPQP